MPEAQPKYAATAMALHWLSALVICALFGIGWYMVDLPKGPARGETFALHKSLGLTVFLLTVWRLGWRVRKQPPPWPVTMPRWQARLADSVHKIFYGLLLLQPLTGYLSSSFSGYSTKFFGLPLPDWGHHNPPLNEFFTELHVAGSIALLVLVALHLAGVLSHLLAPGERMVRRMLPWR